MKQTLHLRQQPSINLRYCYSSRRATQTTSCRRPAIRPLLVWTYVPYR